MARVPCETSHVRGGRIDQFHCGLFCKKLVYTSFETHCLRTITVVVSWSYHATLATETCDWCREINLIIVLNMPYGFYSHGCVPVFLMNSGTKPPSRTCVVHFLFTRVHITHTTMNEQDSIVFEEDFAKWIYCVLPQKTYQQLHPWYQHKNRSIFVSVQTLIILCLLERII